MNERRHIFPFEVKSVTESKAEDGEEYYIVEGILSTSSVDQGNDIVETQAMVKSFQEHGFPRFLHQHDGFKGMPLGKMIDYKVLDDGQIWVKNEVIKGITFNDDIIRKAKHGEYGGLSIGYKTIDSEYNGKIRIIKELKVRDSSLVIFPMNEEAILLNVKSIEGLESLKDIEKNLREEGGYSQKATEAIISKIKSFSLGEQDEEEVLGEQEKLELEKKQEEEEAIKLQEQDELKFLSDWLDELNVNKDI